MTTPYKYVNMPSIRGLGERRGETGRTICTSQDVPSVIYLKHRSQTHRMPLAFSRLTAPAKRSIVRPCPITSSPSPSVSGYGEKYLRAEDETRGHLSENLPQGRGGNKERKLLRSPSFDLPRPKIDLVKVAPCRGHRG